MYAKGWVDVGTVYNRYVGWACKSGSAETVSVHIYVDGNFIGAGVASNIREFAVQTACGSTHSKHGFDIAVNVPSALLNGSNRSVVVYAIYADGSHEKLDNTPLQVQFAALPGRARPTQMGDIVGRNLAYSWGGPLNYFGHIGIWDGSNVIEATGTENSGDTLKVKSWNEFSSAPDLWQTITPVTDEFKQYYCSRPVCVEYNEWGVGPSTSSTLAYGYTREIAAKSAYVYYLIGASYTRLADFSPAKQGHRYGTKACCSPFGSGPCRDVWTEKKATRGVYRCETFVLHAWATSSIKSGYPTILQRVGAYENPAAVRHWDMQIAALLDKLIRTPRHIYENMQMRWW